MLQFLQGFLQIQSVIAFVLGVVALGVFEQVRMVIAFNAEEKELSIERNAIQKKLSSGEIQYVERKTCPSCGHEIAKKNPY